MVDRASASITIDRDKSAIMAAIADFPAYPEWVTGIKQVEVLASGPDGRASRVRFSLDAAVIKDDYVLDYDWTGDDEVRWHLVEARTQKFQEGSYRLESSGGATRVVYDLAIETSLPIPGLLKRRAQGVIMDTALKGLKKRLEA